MPRALYRTKLYSYKNKISTPLKLYEMFVSLQIGDSHIYKHKISEQRKKNISIENNVNKIKVIKLVQNFDQLKL